MHLEWWVHSRGTYRQGYQRLYLIVFTGCSWSAASSAPSSGLIWFLASLAACVLLRTHYHCEDAPL